MKNVAKKNKTIQNKDHEEEDEDGDDIKAQGYDMEEGNDKEEKLIGKSHQKKRNQSKSPERITSVSSKSKSSAKISDQPPNADEKMHGLREMLRSISVGKYYTKMYFNGKDT